METENDGYEGTKKKYRKTLNRLLSSDSDSSKESSKDSLRDSPKESPRTSHETRLSVEEIHTPHNEHLNTKDVRSPSPRKTLSPRMRKLSLGGRKKSHEGDTSPAPIIINTETDVVTVAHTSTSTETIRNNQLGQQTLSNNSKKLRRSGGNPIAISASTNINNSTTLPMSRRASVQTDSKSSLSCSPKYKGDFLEIDDTHISTPIVSVVNTNNTNNNELNPYENYMIDENKHKSFIMNLNIRNNRNNYSTFTSESEDVSINIGVCYYDGYQLVRDGYHGVEILDEGDQFYIVYSRIPFIIFNQLEEKIHNQLQMSTSSLSEEKIINIYKQHFPIVVKSKIYTFSNESFARVFPILIHSIHVGYNNT